MKALKIIMGLVVILVSMPIAVYLQYKILTLVNATELMWFLFWVNVPLVILMQAISKIAEAQKV
jgi:hypothetical protein